MSTFADKGCPPARWLTAYFAADVSILFNLLFAA